MYAVRTMPAIVLQVLEDNEVYKNLYFGLNLATAVPQDLWTHDWEYRTTLMVPQAYDRADIWLTGQLFANRSRIVGMYTQVRSRYHEGRRSRTHKLCFHFGCLPQGL
jgi:exo-1,4-beta-D-glucosaminidase